jgi:hypothetical protein
VALGKRPLASGEHDHPYFAGVAPGTPGAGTPAGVGAPGTNGPLGDPGELDVPGVGGVIRFINS